MTNEQAIKILKEERTWESSERIKDAFDLAIKALEKQIPMKIEEIHVDEYFCPSCQSENCCNDATVKHQYCPECVQSLIS